MDGLRIPGVAGDDDDDDGDDDEDTEARTIGLGMIMTKGGGFRPEC